MREPRLQSGPSAPRRRRLAVERPAWEARYVRSTIVSDAVAVTVVCTAAVLLPAHVTDLGNGLLSVALGPAVALLLLIAISLVGASDPAMLGTGSAEFRRLAWGFTTTAIGLGLVGLAAGLVNVRFWVFVVIPVACLLAAFGRFGLRKALHRKRAAGECTRHVLAVGTPDAVADLIGRTRRDRRPGWTIIGACTPTGAGLGGSDAILGVPVIGDLDAVAKEASRKRHHIVLVCATPGWSPARLHRLAWDIEGVGAELVVDPRLTEVTGPRLHAEPIDGLPLLRMTHPALSAAGRLVKALIDRIGAALLLLLLAPLLVGLAIGIRLGGGRALWRQTRVGHDGRRFALLRFRSTRTDPDRRATKLDSWIRRNGLDELPQLLNVLGGSMSLIGPRPARPDEVALYPPEIGAACVVRPGLTGLWQSDGSTSLSPEENLRLNMRYLEHWSLMQDVTIVWQSVRAAIQPAHDH